MHTGRIKYYDKEIKLCADYRSKNIIRPEDIWQSITDIQNIKAGNIKYVQYALQMVKGEKKRDLDRKSVV